MRSFSLLFSTPPLSPNSEFGDARAFVKSWFLLVSVCAALSAAAAEPQPFAPAPLQLALPPSAASVPGRPPINYSSLSVEDRLRLEQLKPGITRKQVLQHFTADGGLIFPMSERYYLRGTRLADANKVVMVEITFKPAAMDEATFSDPQRRSAWFRSHDWFPGAPNDVVRAVSIPYESGVAID
jgi:hypothetical protein